MNTSHQIHIPRLGQPCQAAKDHDAKDAHSAAEKPVAHHLVVRLGEERRLSRAFCGTGLWHALRRFGNVATQKLERRLGLGRGISSGNFYELQNSRWGRSERLLS